MAFSFSSSDGRLSLGRREVIPTGVLLRLDVKRVAMVRFDSSGVAEVLFAFRSSKSWPEASTKRRILAGYDHAPSGASLRRSAPSLNAPGALRHGFAPNKVALAS